ncbi:hypothetical protein QZM66_03055 [Burkholderia contaminans]|nr:hypothetical protein [Burkholderia contaminans]
MVTVRCRPSHRTTFRNSGRLPSTGIPVASTGFLYMSRHLNTSEALVLFDRAKPKLSLGRAVPFRGHPDAAGVLRDFNILLR